MTEKLLNKHFHLVSPCDLDLWPSYPKTYTALLQVIIYQLAKYEKDPMKHDREIGWRRWWERRKIKSKKEKTLQQQKGLPTLSADLNNLKLFLIHVFVNFQKEDRIPGRPYSVDIETDTITLSWDIPENVREKDTFTVECRERGNDTKWEVETEGLPSNQSTLQICDLQPDTGYLFKVSVVDEDGNSDNMTSPVSDDIYTSKVNMQKKKFNFANVFGKYYLNKIA